MHPQDAAVLYLRRRIDDDLDRRRVFFERSIAAVPTLAWPVLGLGTLALARGDWQEALDRVRNAETLKADPDLTAQAAHIARLGQGQAETLLDEYRARSAQTRSTSGPLHFCSTPCPRRGIPSRSRRSGPGSRTGSRPSLART